jgi:hypothetical protein
MQVIPEVEIAELIRSCLPALDEVEAAYIEDCYLQEPPTPLAVFSEQWRLSTKALKELRSRSLLRLKDRIARKGITSIADVI